MPRERLLIQSREPDARVPEISRWVLVIRGEVSASDAGWHSSFLDLGSSLP